jgi:hypothetical protein
MSKDQFKRYIFVAAVGFWFALIAIGLLWAAGIVHITFPGRDQTALPEEDLLISDVHTQDTAVRSLTFRRAWFDIELRVRYGDEWFVVKKPGWARNLLAEEMQSSGERYAREQLSGSFLILQTGKPSEKLDWQMHLELRPPNARRGQYGFASLYYSELKRADRRLEKATPADGERKILLFGFAPLGPEVKTIAVEVICHPIDVSAVRAEDSPEKKE